MSGLFGSSVNQSAPAAASLQIQTSNYGRPIPIIYGTTRMAGNLVWYSDFKSIPHTTTQGGKGGGQRSTTYTYTVAAILALCEGVLGSISEKTSSQWSYRGYAGLTTYTYSGVRTIYTGQAKYTPAQKSLSVYTGTSSQSAFPYVTSNHPTEALAYKNLAYVASSAYDLADQASMPQHLFEVIGILANAGATGIYDADPYDLCYDLLTNTVYGANFPSAKLADSTGNYLYAVGLWFSPAYTTQSSAAEMIQKIATLANCEWVWSGGVLRFIPYGLDSVTGGPGVTLAQGSTALSALTYTPGSLATPVYNLNDDDFLGDGSSDPVVVARGTQADAFNQVQVKYANRFCDYADAIAEAKDLAAIEAFGLLPMPVVEAPEICDPTVARTVAQLTLQRAQYIRNTYKFKLGYRFILLDPMDLVTLTESTGSGLTNQAVRITSITESSDGTLDIEAEDVIGNITTAVQYPEQLPAGYQVNYNADPGSVSTPVIFDAPGRMTTTGYELWIAADGAGAYWGGALVWVSLDGSTYRNVGKLTSARYGSLSSSASAGTADPDTSSTFAVNLSVSQGSITGGSTGDADNGNTLCYVGGELISYSTATLTSSYNYNLTTYIRRGVYGTTQAAHASGSSFVRLDSGVFTYAYDPSLVGKQVYVKLQSFNTWGAGVQDISTLSPFTYTIAGPIGAPQDVTGVTATSAIGGVQLSWSAVLSPDLAEYEIRRGSTWSSATLVGRSRTTSYLVSAPAAGSTTWLVKALNQAGTYSVNATAVTLSVNAPSAPSVTQQVIDNNVLLSWTASSSTLPVATYQVRRGAVFSSATVIGNKSGLFTTVFETVAGTYTYWIAGIDSAGNLGTPGSVVAIVSQPPDYVLKANIISTFSGTLSNAAIDLNGVLDDTLVLPVDIATTYQAHFTGNAWASPSDQVTAGKSLFIEPAATSGYYEEFVDYGAVLAASKVSVGWSETDVGTPAVTCSIAYSPDNITYTTLSATTAAYLTNFRYLKIRLAATSSTGLDLAVIKGLTIRLDVKLKNDAGTVSAVSTDAAGTAVTFATSFSAVTSITLTAGQASSGGAAAAIPLYIFAGGANPTGFTVMLFNTSGTRISGSVGWSVKGY